MLIKYKDWLESSAHTRARREIALGLRTPVGMGSLHGHSTAPAWQVKSISKKIKKAGKSKKKVDKSASGRVDDWLKEVEALEKDLAKLKDISSKKKPEKSPEKINPTKPKTEIEKEEPNKSKIRKSEKSDVKDQAGKEVPNPKETSEKKDDKSN